MAKTDIGPKIGIDGEAQFRRELNAINQGMKTLDAEAKAVAASMQDETDAEKKAAAQKDVLNRQILSQKEKLEKLQQGLEQSAKKFGEADTRTQKWQKAVYDATADLANMEHELKGLDSSVDEAAGSMQEAEKAATGWADVMKGNLCSEAVKKGVQALAKSVKEVASALWDATKSGAAYADTYNTMAATTGMSTETLQEYAYMADLIDVSMDTLTGAQTKMLNSMRKAKDGTGDAAETWKTLGIRITDANGSLRSTEDVLNDTLAALGSIENETERDAAAMTIFGRSAQDLNPLIETGADKLKELRKEAHDAGYILSGSALSALNKQQDALDRLSKKTEAVGNRFAAKLAPGVASAAEALNGAFDNPRVKLGLDALSTGLGNLADRAGNLAAQILPELMKVFGVLDERLYLYNDTQIELANNLNELQSAHAELAGEYKNNAQNIVGERERIEKLWAELQTLTDETGNVKKADEERADYILHELNNALGTEYTRNGAIIEQYQTMQKEIGNLIKQKEAEALLEANKDLYTNADAKRREALQNAADYYAQIGEAEQAVANAQAALDRQKENLRNTPGYAYKGEAYVEEMTGMQKYELQKAKTALDKIKNDYETARNNAAEYYETVYRYESAQSAILQKNYDGAIQLLTDEYSVNLDYYKRKKELDEKDKKDLQNNIESAKRAISEYKRNMEAGLTGFTAAGLKELEDYVADAKRILDGKDVGSAYLDGLESALRDKQRKARLREAANEVARTVDVAARRTLEVQSPSKKAKYIGRMWGKGLIIGVESQKTALRESASDLGRTLMAASWPGAQEIGSYYGGNYSVPIGKQGGAGETSSYTTNLGGINITIPGAGAVNEDVLAQRIAVRLTDELTKAQRGGRR